MFKCKPERNVRQIFLMLFSGVLLTVGAFALGNYLQNGVVRFIGWGFLIVSIYLLYRFSLTEVEYTLDHGTFLITKIVGNKRTEQGALDLKDSIALVSKAEYRAGKMGKDVSTFWDYSQNLGGSRWCYVFSFQGKKAMIEFEPNNAFVALFRDEIDKAKRGEYGGDPGDDSILL